MKTTSSLRQSSRSETLTGWLFAAPALIGFALLTVVPMIVSLVLSLTDYSVFKQEVNFLGLGNYLTMFSSKDVYLKDALKATAYYTLLNVPASLLVALLLALALNTNIKGRGIFRSIFYLPSIVPSVASCVVWLWLLNQQYGLLTTVAKNLGFGTPGWLWDKNTVIPTIVMMGLWNTGNTMVIFLAGLQGIPRVYYEAVDVDGGNAWHKLFYVVLPMLTPTIFFNAMTAIIGSFQVFTEGYILTKGGPGNSSLFYVYYLFRQAFEKANMGYACALAWFLMLVILFITLIVLKTQKKWVYYGGD